MSFPILPKEIIEYMKQTLGLLFCLLSSISLLAQEDYSYVGVIKLNDTAFISYKLDFIEKDGLLRGYSTTDIGGSHETKSFISGYFDDEAESLSFNESGILYTKSPITQNDFCFVHFEGRLKKLNDRQNIEGQFEGLYSDGKKCINGEINMSNLKKILKRSKKLDRKIDKSILISKERKDQVNLVKMTDSLSLNVIKKNEVLTVFSSEEKINLTIFDAGQEDGDVISVLVNGRTVLNNYKVTNSKKLIPIQLIGSKTIIKVVAIDNGNIGGNTAKIDISDGINTIETIMNLGAKETASFEILQKEL